MTASGPRMVLGEAVANGGAWQVLTAPLMAVAATVGALVAWTTVGEAGAAVAQQQDLDGRGRQLLAVTPTVGPLDGTLCERIRTLPGVRAAVGIRSPAPARTTTGLPVDVLAVTAGFEDLLADDGAPAGRASDVPDVYAGSALAERAGLATGTWLALAGDDPAGHAGRWLRPAAGTSTVRVVAGTDRTTWFDDALLVLVPPPGPVDRCLVDPVPAARAQVAAAIPALSPSDRQVVVGAQVPGLETNREPEQRLAAVPAGATVPLAGALVALSTVAWWYARRVEWALYRAFGLGPGRLRLLAATEWSLVTGLPLLVGAAWACALAPAGTAPLAYRLAAWHLAATALVAAVAVPLWACYLRATTPARVLQDP